MTLWFTFKNHFSIPFCSDSVGGIVAGSIALVIIIVVVSVVVRAKHRQSVVTPISSGGAHISTVNTNINTNIHGGYSFILFILENENIHAYKAIWPTIFMSDCLIAKMYGLLAILHKWICLFCVEQRLRGFDRSDLIKISCSGTVRIRTADSIKLWWEQMSCKENCLAIFSIVKVLYINI